MTESRLTSIFLVSAIAVIGTGSSSRAGAAEASAVAISFNRSIRPILSDRCFSCHGPDSAKRKAHFRLDRKEDAYGSLPDDPDLRAFVPGHSEKSEAYRRITAIDSDDIMPPAKSHLKLEAREKELIGKWIDQGAQWEEHWAFIKPVRPEAPAVKDGSWPRNDIDRFVLARLEAQGLHPSPEADKPTLIRRVSLDLTGIPPTPAEVDDFVADVSPDAFDKVVDRLLASPRYGEQMAVQWLDYARYADSHGYQADPERFMWHWRDWVINAFNKNMPFDQFTVEQLAGDLLPNPTVDQRVATGFNRNPRINGEGGIIAEEWRVEGVVDRVEATSEVWLGLTMGCCRCHDHKFDPITQKEFYSFAGFFNSINETGISDLSIDKGKNISPVLKLSSPEQQKEIDALTAKLDSAKARLKEFDTHITDSAAAWEAKQAERGDVNGLVARFPLHGDFEGRTADAKAIPATFDGKVEGVWGDGQSGKALRLDGKGNFVNAGDAVSFDGQAPFSYGAWVNVKTAGTILSKMDDAPGYRGFDVRVQNGVLEVHMVHSWSDDALKIVTSQQVPKNKWTHVMVSYDGSRKAEGIKVYLNGVAQESRKEKDHLTGTIETKTPLVIGKRIRSDPFDGMIEEVEFYDRALLPDEIRDAAIHPVASAISKVAAEARTPEQKQQLESLFRNFSPEVSKVEAEAAAAKKSLDELNAQLSDTMVMEDLPTPRDNFILLRGQYDKHGDKVETGLPAVLPPMPAGEPTNRLGLARWIVDPSNPLTSRVQVNRFWEKFFGTGIVKTSENLGTQSEPPANPELLDWLATELVREKWDLKAFQKLVVTSATYRQSSAVTPELLERDPENRLLARGPRYRLAAETIRDQALAASGLLVEKLGGPSVKPYEPANLWEGNLYGNLSNYVQDKGERLYRRSLYTFWKRTATPPNLTVFDMPSREYCVIKRSRTDTPLQALDLLNDPQYVEASRVLAERMMTEGGSTPEDRLLYGFRRATCRRPTADEMRILLGGLQKQIERYHADPKGAAELLHIGEAPVNPALDAAELAAYTITSSVILNLDEMVNKQ